SHLFWSQTLRGEVPAVATVDLQVEQPGSDPLVCGSTGRGIPNRHEGRDLTLAPGQGQQRAGPVVTSDAGGGDRHAIPPVRATPVSDASQKRSGSNASAKRPDQRRRDPDTIHEASAPTPMASRVLRTPRPKAKKSRRDSCTPPRFRAGRV